MRISTYLFLLLLCSASLCAQKNAIYGTFGIYNSLSYERVLSHNVDKGNKIVVNIHGGRILQFYYAGDDDWRYNYLAFSMSGLIGNNVRFFELGGGAGNLWQQKNQEPFKTRLIPNVLLGYRSEKNGFLFRFGTGLPSLIYVSLGYRF